MILAPATPHSAICVGSLSIRSRSTAVLSEIFPPTNANALALVRSVAQLGVSLGMATTAEGVETKEQLETVRAEGCAEMQGYYVSPPAPAEEIERLIIAQGSRSANSASEIARRARPVHRALPDPAADHGTVAP